MAKLLAVYTLGRKGVNLTKSPVHLDDDELRLAQNVSLSLDKAIGGLPMRGGLQALTAALAGPIRGAVDLPLPDPTTRQRYLYAALGPGDATNTWLRTSDGTSWSPVTTPGRVTSEFTTSFYTWGRQAATLDGRLYYASDAYVKYPTSGQEQPPVYRWDLATDARLFRVPWAPVISSPNAFFIADVWVHRGTFVIAVHDQPGVGFRRGRALLFDPNANTLAQLALRFGNDPGEQATGEPITGTSFGSRIFVATYESAGGINGKLFSINPLSETTWTTEIGSSPTHGYILSLAGYGGRLYAACNAFSGADPPLVLVRQARATWSTSRTGADANAVYGPLVAFDGKLYAGYHKQTGAIAKIEEFDGTAWSVSLDVSATYGYRQPGCALIWRGNLYWVFLGTGATRGATADGFILRKTPGGAWTQVATSVATMGPLAALEV